MMKHFGIDLANYLQVEFLMEKRWKAYLYRGGSIGGGGGGGAREVTAPQYKHECGFMKQMF